MRRRPARRSGATLVESALIYPLVFLFTLGLAIGAIGIFRYQMVARLARVATRYASVHGKEYEKQTGNPAATPEDIFNNAIAPNVVACDPAQLSYAVTWNASNEVFDTSIVNGQIVGTRNVVRVTVTYQWVPEAFLGGITLSSTSVADMCY